MRSEACQDISYEDRRDESIGRQRVSTKETENFQSRQHVYVLRLCVCLVAMTTVWEKDHIQTYINFIYSYLLTTWFFNSVYFETFFTTVCYGLIMGVYPWLVDHIRYLDKYKIHPSVRYVHTTRSEILKMAVVYVSPLMFLDTFMVKKYYGVDPSDLAEKRRHWIQVTRSLPIEPPSVLAIVVQLGASFIVFDALFFFIHLALHKNYYLYNYIHKYHHDHDVLHSHVTNQLTVVERLALILSANFALKVFNSHPFTRMVFIPLFIGILVDNHSGYDFPFGLHKLVPFGLVGGSRKHFRHHVHGKGYYQPILTYLDLLLDKYRVLSRQKDV